METSIVLETILQKMRLYGAELAQPLARAIGLTTEQLQTRAIAAELTEINDNKFGLDYAQPIVTLRAQAIERLKRGLPFTWSAPQPMIAFGPR